MRIARKLALIVFMCLYAFIQTATSVGALSADQKAIYQLNANYFDINACSATGTDDSSSPTTSGTITGGVSFDTGMTIDDDGVGSSHGDPNHQGQTSYADGKLNADTTNYIALAPGWASAHDLKLGDVAAVQYKGKTAYAVYGDNYKGSEVHGEGSLHLAIALGVTDSAHPGTSNASSGVHYVVFPGSNSKLNGSADQTKIDQVAAEVSGGGATSTSSDATTTASSSSSLTDDQKISSTFIVGFSASTPQSTIENVVKTYKIGGIFILGTKDAAGDGFTKSFFDQLNNDAGHKLVISSDEEGVFERYKYSFDFPSAKDIAAMSDDKVKDLGANVGKALVANGVNTDLAPVLDVAKNGSNTDAGTAGRSFSDDPDVVAAKAGAFAQGLSGAGVNPVYKHFPGLGSTSGNSDTESVTSPSLATLKAKDLKPYESLANKNNAAIMLDNAHVPDLTDAGDVASTSAATVQLLRGDYGFTGVITTDDLAAKGVPGSTSSAIAKSLKAGVDMPLFAYTSNDVIDSAISAAKAANVSTDASLEKIQSFVGQADDTTPKATASSASCCPSATADNSPGTALTGSGPGEQVYNYFIGKGLSATSASAVTGNLQLESANWSAIDGWGGGGGNFYGIAQWDRANRYANLVKQSGSAANAAKLSYQLDFVWYELGHGYESVLKELKGNDSLEAKTIYWGRVFEGAITNGALQMQAERIVYAKQWAQKGGGSAAGATAPAAGAAETDTTTAASGCSDSSSGSTGTAVTVDGHAWPVDIKKSEANNGYQWPCKSICHHDGTPAFDLSTNKAVKGDFADVVGRAEFAISDGTVDSLKIYDGIAGCYAMEFKSDDGYVYWYGHMRRPTVNEGDKVKIGQKVAEVGESKCTGNGSYPHLHIDRGSPKGSPGGLVSSRDAGMVPLINGLYAALPEN